MLQGILGSLCGMRTALRSSLRERQLFLEHRCALFKPH
jgi:hypothetical protein